MKNTQGAFAERMARYVAAVEAAARAAFPENEHGLREPMRYSLLAGGKRLRPVLVMAFAEHFGAPAEDAGAYALAIEMLHTYTLIHDDLPAMDNDTLRRGKPTCHAAFGEWQAILAGDALQAESFAAAAAAENMTAGQTRRAIASLAEAASGVCVGQYMDLQNESGGGRTFPPDVVATLKTCALFSCACQLGTIAATPDYNELAEEAARAFGYLLGMAFQIQDDILNAVGDEKTLGKNAGTDGERGKLNFVTVFGLAKAQELADAEFRELELLVAENLGNDAFLSDLCGNLRGRRT
ncbi:MAG: polyprenyl synthetase family protein [Oscillospiraceae bacterium]|nr:polyprenyl synthetase family protein [Oscillospiraceae bacterium]